MKSYAGIFILTMATSLPTWGATTPQESCNSMAGMAEAIMDARFSGVPQSAASIVAAQVEPPVNRIAALVVEHAYGLPLDLAKPEQAIATKMVVSKTREVCLGAMQ